MTTPYTVADLVADFLPQVGVRTVFGIVSVHNIPMLDAIGKRNALLKYLTRCDRTRYQQVIARLGLRK